MGEIIRKEGAGLHLKTAGTTWLEEIVGLADSGGDGLAMAKEIYRAAYDRFDEVAALRHVQSDRRYDPGM